MSFVSYAQNFEDVMLWRALKHIERGFYIDIGANDPSIDSVTRAFYERGWHGINVEPLNSHFIDLERERPLDVNLRCAAGSEHGEIDLWETDVRGWATADKFVIKQHAQAGHKGVYQRVPIVTLGSICEKFVTGDIHFLKIDVEGLEENVLKGANFRRYRPWIIILEATKPNSTDENYGQWEHLLLNENYIFAYADGLNRFYVAKEHSELLSSFRYQPNIFDEFIRSEKLNSELITQQAQNCNLQIEKLTAILNKSAADYLAQDIQIETLSEMLKVSDTDRLARAEQIETLSEMLKVSDADRLARAEQIVTLTTWLKETKTTRIREQNE